MLPTFQKPENAIRRARELQGVGQHEDALLVLHSTIGHRKFRSQGWDKTQEEIMLRYVQLCVELQKLKLAREGLHLYRSISQQQNVQSFGKVLRELRDKAEAKLTAAKERVSSIQAIGQQLQDDLEAEETPESLMLSTLQIEVRDEPAKELNSALKICWECYKLILDLLRFSPKLERLYHETAHKALEFCRSNERSQEFKRLSDLLRNHYVLFQRNRNKPDYEPLLRPETHLETRLKLLTVAEELQLWNQSFQAAEDVYNIGIFEFAQKCVTAKEGQYAKLRGTMLMNLATYYGLLAKIFWVSENHLFHAQARLRTLLHIKQHKKSRSQQDVVTHSDLAVLAVLAIPLGSGLDTLQENTPMELEYKKRLSALLGHSSIPSRESLKNVLATRLVLQVCSEDVRKLYMLVEGEFTPLKICSEAQPMLTSIGEREHLKLYLDPLKRVIFHKLVVQLSSVYVSMSVDYFTSKLCPETFFKWREAEKVVVSLVHQGQVLLRLDYAQKAIYFGSATLEPEIAMRTQLSDIAKSLSAALSRAIGGSLHKERVLQEKEAFYVNIVEKLEREKERLKKRHEEVQQRREKQMEEQKEQEELRKKQEQLKQQQEEQQLQQRKEEAQRLLEEQRLKAEKERSKEEAATQIVAEFRNIAANSGGVKIMIKGKLLEDITVADIVFGTITFEDFEKAQEEHRNKERLERARQRKAEAKRLDHLVRALREEEVPLLEAWKTKTREEDSAALVELQHRYNEEHKAAYEEGLVAKKNFAVVAAFKEEFVGKLMETRIQEYKEKRAAQLKRVAAQLKAAKIERARARKMKEDEEQMELEMEKLKLEEEAKRLQEAEEQRRRLEEQKKRDEARIQRDLEFERRTKERDDEIRRRRGGFERGGFERGGDDFSWRRGD